MTTLDNARLAECRQYLDNQLDADERKQMDNLLRVMKQKDVSMRRLDWGFADYIFGLVLDFFTFEEIRDNDINAFDIINKQLITTV